MTSIVGARVVGTRQVTTITIRDGHIADLGEPPGSAVTDMTDLIAAPGLIDLQINGGYGDDFTSDPGAIWRVGQRLTQQGVTSFLPTVITAPKEAVDKAMAVLAAGPPPGYRGARPLGLHIEGPMLSAARRGAHPESLLRLPSLDLVRGWTRAAGVRMVTMAPELPGAKEVVDRLVADGVIVAAGHTSATYDQARLGFGWGMSHVTHLFNAMEPFGHRLPGPIGAMISDGRVTAGLIVDGFHSHPAVVTGAWKWFGPDRLALVTDAMAAVGMGDGEFRIGEVPLSVEKGKVVNAEGRLAGSTLTMDAAVRNLVAFTGCGEDAAIAAASLVPAAIVGRPDLGRLDPGAAADLVFFDDELEVVATMIAGDIVWRRDTP